MTLIIFVATVAFCLFGYFIMDRIDKFLENNNFSVYDNTSQGLIYFDDDEEEKILIFGENELTNLIKEFCDDQNYPYKNIVDINNINYNYKYLSLLALSDNDTDNLTISSICKKVCSIQYTIAICNSISNLKFYNQLNLEKVLLYDEQLERMYIVIREMMENVIGNQV